MRKKFPNFISQENSGIVHKCTVFTVLVNDQVFILFQLLNINPCKIIKYLHKGILNHDFQVLVVAGGYQDPDDAWVTNSKYKVLSSTEMLTLGTNYWTVATPLPKAMYGFASTSLNGKIYFIGEYKFYT